MQFFQLGMYSPVGKTVGKVSNTKVGKMPLFLVGYLRLRQLSPEIEPNIAMNWMRYFLAFISVPGRKCFGVIRKDSNKSEK